MIMPPSVDKGNNKGSGFGKIVKLNDSLRAQPK
ncbi:MAG: hypothetical protein K0Q73_6390 [Paenibacillus sp.]|nr:hypothetical protein [Paenibacillus sp.]